MTANGTHHRVVSQLLVLNKQIVVKIHREATVPNDPSGPVRNGYINQGHAVVVVSWCSWCEPQKHRSFGASLASNLVWAEATVKHVNFVFLPIDTQFFQSLGFLQSIFGSEASVHARCPEFERIFCTSTAGFAFLRHLVGHVETRLGHSVPEL